MVADFEMLVSVYNSNYFKIRVERGIVLFRHSHHEVGCYGSSPVHCPCLVPCLDPYQSIRCSQLIDDAEKPKVGQMIIKDSLYNGGKVTDVLFTVSFNTKVRKWEELPASYYNCCLIAKLLVSLQQYCCVFPSLDMGRTRPGL